MIANISCFDHYIEKNVLFIYKSFSFIMILPLKFIEFYMF